MGRHKETEHVLIQFVRGVNRYQGGFYVCRCGYRSKQFHKWRDHRRDERKVRFTQRLAG